MFLGLEKLLLTKKALAAQDDHWFYSRETIKNGTPSRKRGMSYEMEMKTRREGVRFLQILDQGSHAYVKRYNPETKYNPKIVSTAAVWFHRFYMIHPMQIFDRYEIAAACFHLASKAEDQPHSLGSLSVYSTHILNLLSEPHQTPAAELEEELKILENCIIETMGFMVCVRHPYLYNEMYMSELIASPDQVKQIQQLANQYATESLGSVLCLTTDPRKLSIAFISWACKQLEIPLDTWKRKENMDLTHWCESFKLRIEDIEQLFNEYEAHVKVNTSENAAAIAVVKTPRGSKSRKPSPFQTIMTMQMFCSPIFLDGNDNFQYSEVSQRSRECTGYIHGRAES